MKIFELIFPNNIKCINCGKEIEREKVFCKNCENKIKIINSREKINNLNIYSPFKYCDIIKNLILNFKYNNKKYLAYLLAKLLVKNYNFKNIDFITFIPLNKNKLKIRGFNQAKLLAKEISKITKIPLLSTLEKIVDTPSQTTKNYLERQENIKDSFIVKEESLPQIKDKNLLIIDDVCTTGATLLEASHVLHQSGATTLSALTLAKVI